MDDVKTPSREERKSALSGLGTSRKRVEDARFTQGKGNYVDDIKLKGMLFGDFDSILDGLACILDPTSIQI